MELKGTNVSEQVFERYLLSAGYEEFRYEEEIEGIGARVDYSFDVGGVTVRCEVKEWEPTEAPTEFDSIDPYGPIRDKIEEGRVKFKEYKGRGEACCLVLYHHGPQPISLDFITVYGAMLGGIGTVFPVGDGTAAIADEGTTGFLGSGGKMRYRKEPLQRGSDRNTTISAIIVPSYFKWHERQYGIEVRKREIAESKELTLDQCIDIAVQASEAEATKLADYLRVVVYDNPLSAVTLPSSFPLGPYDERFGPSAEGEGVTKLRTGRKILEIEAIERELGIEA